MKIEQTPNPDPVLVPVRFFKPDDGTDYAKTPAGLAARVGALEAEVSLLAAHLGAVVEHLANGGKASGVPVEPPAPAEPVSTPEIDNVAVALAALTPEQKAALKALLG